MIAGRDERDPTSLADPIPSCTEALGRGVRGVRIGVDEEFLRQLAHPDVVAALFAALDVLKKQGAEIVEVSVPAVEPVLEAWFVICAAEALVGQAIGARHQPALRRAIQLALHWGFGGAAVLR